MRRVLAPLLVTLAAFRCNDPGPLVRVAGDDFSAWPWATVGGGGTSDLVAYTRPGVDGYVLRVVRVDPLRPDALEPVIDVPLDALPRTGGISAADNAVAVVAGGGVTIVDVGGPTGTQAPAAGAEPAGPLEAGIVTVTSFPVAGAERAAVDGGWVLVSSGSTLTLATRLGESVSTYVAPAPVTALVPVGGFFIAFTGTGYVHVTPDPAAPVFVDVQDSDLSGIRAAYRSAAGTRIVVAGPSSHREGWSLIQHIDLWSPGQLQAHAYTHVEGTFSAFAYDGESTSLLRFSDGSSTEDASGYLVRDRDWGPDGGHESVLTHTFAVTRIPLPAWGRGPDEEPGLAARAGHLFALSGEGMGYYRLER